MMDHQAESVLVAEIARRRLWATDEETAAWLQTAGGQRIAAMIAQAREATDNA